MNRRSLYVVFALAILAAAAVWCVGRAPERPASERLSRSGDGPPQTEQPLELTAVTARGDRNGVLGGASADPITGDVGPTPWEGRTITVHARSTTGGSFWEGLCEVEVLYGVSLDVVATSTPLPSTIVASRDSPGSSFFRPDDRRGRELEDTVLGELKLRERPPLVASVLLGNRVLQAQTIEEDMHEVHFTLDPFHVVDLLSTVRIRVRLPDGEPAERASVVLRDTQLGLTAGSVTNPQGLAGMEGVLPAVYGLGIRAGDHAFHRSSIQLAGGSVDLGEVTLQRLVELSGRVIGPVDADFTPDPDSDEEQLGISLRALHADGQLSPSAWQAVDASGRFRLDVLPGHYVIEARGQRWASTPLEIQVPRGPLSLEVQHADDPSDRQPHR